MITDTTHNEPPPVVQEGGSGPLPFGIMFKLSVPGLWFVQPGNQVYANLLDAVIGGALRARGILCPDELFEEKRFSTMGIGTVLAHHQDVLALFVVTDKDAGLATVRVELERLEALPYSEIGWFDGRELIWNRWYPQPSPGGCQHFMELMKKWREFYPRKDK